MSETLCGTCRFWDHAGAARDRERNPGHQFRTARCLWGVGLKLPEWCSGIKGFPFTNEGGTTERGCNAWEASGRRMAIRNIETGDKGSSVAARTGNPQESVDEQAPVSP